MNEAEKAAMVEKMIAAHFASSTPMTAAFTAAGIEGLVDALRRADQFITNGIELGYIRMPDADCPDTAHQTPRIVRAALENAGVKL